MHIVIYMYICVYVYMYREGDREREIVIIESFCLCTHIIIKLWKEIKPG